MKQWSQLTPVVLIAFNRPDTTQRVFEAIRAAQPSRLFIIADGPREGRQDDIEKCRDVRRVVERIDWECDVQRIYAEQNMGCKRRVVSGISTVFEQTEQAIFLEDDCLPHPSFFAYCEELLERFKDDARVTAISGDNFLSGWRRTDNSYFYSRYVHIWGWATWRRSWERYDPEMKLWPEVRDGDWLRDLFPDSRAAMFWRRLLQYTYDGDIDTWDYQLLFSAWIHNSLGVIPYYNMISNLGFRPDATHTGGYTPYAEKKLDEMRFPLRHPRLMVPDARADAITGDMFYFPPRLTERIRRKVLRLLRDHRSG